MFSLVFVERLDSGFCSEQKQKSNHERISGEKDGRGEKDVEEKKTDECSRLFVFFYFYSVTCHNKTRA